MSTKVIVILCIFQISIDIPRMSPLVPLFQQQIVQEVSHTVSVHPLCFIPSAGFPKLNSP